MSQEVWKHLANGVDLIYLPELPGGPKKPEIAILRLPEKMYNEFDDDPQGFLEKNDVFHGVPLNRVDNMHSAKKKGKGISVIVLAVHRPSSTVVSFSEPEGS
jgi:hypothetical protein